MSACLICIGRSYRTTQACGNYGLDLAPLLFR